MKASVLSWGDKDGYSGAGSYWTYEYCVRAYKIVNGKRVYSLLNNTFFNKKAVFFADNSFNVERQAGTITQSLYEVIGYIYYRKISINNNNRIF